MMRIQRQRNILKLTQSGDVLRIRDLIEELRIRDSNVSESTVRRDIRDLKGQGLIEVDHGCIVSSAGKDVPLPAVAHDSHSSEKRAIGRKAAESIRDGETIVLDSGTTVLELARALSPDIRITCITNALRIAEALASKPNIETIVLGGSMNHHDMALYGPASSAMLRQFHAHRVFLGAAGISAARGVTNTNLSLAQIRKELVEISEQIIVLADTGKFEKSGLTSVVSMDRIDRIVTGHALPAHHRAMLESFAVEVVLA